jgi:hypothetical protein
MGTMNTPKNQRGLFSRLPEDQEYWSGLTERIVDDAAPRLTEFGQADTRWWSEIARYSTVLAAGAAAAVVAVLMLMPAMDGAEAPIRSQNAFGLTPADPIAVALVSEETPPSVGTLIAVRNSEYER